MLTNGFNHHHVSFNQESLTTAQKIVFNTTKRKKYEKRLKTRLSTYQENIRRHHYLFTVVVWRFILFVAHWSFLQHWEMWILELTQNAYEQVLLQSQLLLPKNFKEQCTYNNDER